MSVRPPSRPLWYSLFFQLFFPALAVASPRPLGVVDCDIFEGPTTIYKTGLYTNPKLEALASRRYHHNRSELEDWVGQRSLDSLPEQVLGIGRLVSAAALAFECKI